MAPTLRAATSGAKARRQPKLTAYRYALSCYLAAVELVTDLSDEDLIAMLPQAYRDWYTPDFRARFRGLFDEIETVIRRAPARLTLMSTAHELAFHLLYREAQTWVEMSADSTDDPDDPIHTFGLEVVMRQIDDYYDAVVLDYDVDMLYEASMQGALRTPAFTSEMNIVNMAVTKWFDVFYGPGGEPMTLDQRRQHQWPVERLSAAR